MLLGRSPSELHYDGHYLLCDLLGKGSFGEVWSVMHYRTKLYYALKKSNQTFRGTRDRATFVREIKAMSTIAASVEHHPNIVKYERAWQDKGYFYIVMELCKEGTLRSLIDYNTQKVCDARRKT
jgi:serine/threonine protein kinase